MYSSKKIKYDKYRDSFVEYLRLMFGANRQDVRAGLNWSDSKYQQQGNVPHHKYWPLIMAVFKITPEGFFLHLKNWYVQRNERGRSEK